MSREAALLTVHNILFSALPCRFDPILSLRFYDAIASGTTASVDSLSLLVPCSIDLAPSPDRRSVNFPAGGRVVAREPEGGQAKRALETHRLQDREAASFASAGAHSVGAPRGADVRGLALERVLNEQKWVSQQQACQQGPEALRQGSSMPAWTPWRRPRRRGSRSTRHHPGANRLPPPPEAGEIAAQWWTAGRDRWGGSSATTGGSRMRTREPSCVWSGVVVLDRLGLSFGDAPCQAGCPI